MTQGLRHRNTESVFHDHLTARRRGDLDGDIRANYSPDCAVLTARGVYRGHDGVRESAELLYRAIREATSYRYHVTRCEGRLALLEWSAEGRGGSIRDGVDTYLIEDGWILAQSIHYTVMSSDLSVTWGAGNHAPDQWPPP